MVDEHGEAGPATTGAAATGDERPHERVALDDIEAALGDVATALARMG